ncbi:hypothetical protein BCR44DRAFT_51901 [Catenaria anguillulae PL171]|uniref:Uncharacterized protein n=1 Tax=Catenaria anguillulae PL171 TaxID=765915 RepID=A0A1Y2H5K2_9FUNG|nr:hypothetical protein BCR44DRAFT_51901 [Catenaria anguillulae PL171]
MACPVCPVGAICLSTADLETHLPLDHDQLAEIAEYMINNQFEMPDFTAKYLPPLVMSPISQATRLSSHRVLPSTTPSRSHKLAAHGDLSSSSSTKLGWATSGLAM